MKSKIGKFIPIILFLIIGLFIVNILLTYKNLKILQSDALQVSHSRKIEGQINKILVIVLKIESSQRGYLITNDKSFSKKYSSLVPTVYAEIKELQAMTNENPLQQQEIARLKQNIQQEITILEEEIKINKENDGSGRLKDEVKKGVIEMTNINKIAISIQQDEEKILQKREDESAEGYPFVFITLAFTDFLSIFFIFIAISMTKRELKKRNELEANKDAFINMASHELKTPITSLKIFIQVVLKKLENKNIAEARRYINKIDTQTNKIVQLISDLLDLSRVQTGKMSYEKGEFNIDAIIDEAVEEVQGTTKQHSIKAMGEIKELIYGDRYRIYQVLINLLTNAVKYSPNGGQIIVTSDKKKDMLLISVSDEGIGIDKKFQNKIFDRLYQVTDQVEKTYPGLGIGLFITQEIIHHYGGQIWVTSTKNKGSTFYFTIPLNN